MHIPEKDSRAAVCGNEKIRQLSERPPVISRTGERYSGTDNILLNAEKRIIYAQTVSTAFTEASVLLLSASPNETDEQ